MLLPQLCKQGLHILGVPAPGLQFPVNGNDITALRCDQGALLYSQRTAAAQSLHQRGLLGGGALGSAPGVEIFPAEYGVSVLTLPVGGFLTLGCLIAVMQWALAKSEKKKEAK